MPFMSQTISASKCLYRKWDRVFHRVTISILRLSLMLSLMGPPQIPNYPNMGLRLQPCGGLADRYLKNKLTPLERHYGQVRTFPDGVSVAGHVEG